MAAFSKDTPWGRAQHVTELGQGIKGVDTPGHGGIYVPDELLPRISEAGRRHAKRWSRSENWYEEDCSWAYVALAFPDLFDADNLARARKTLEWIEHPERLKED